MGPTASARPVSASYRGWPGPCSGSEKLAVLVGPGPNGSPEVRLTT